MRSPVCSKWGESCPPLSPLKGRSWQWLSIMKSMFHFLAVMTLYSFASCSQRISFLIIANPQTKSHFGTKLSLQLKAVQMIGQCSIISLFYRKQYATWCCYNNFENPILHICCFPFSSSLLSSFHMFFNFVTR